MPSPPNPLDWIDDELATLERQELRRRIVTHAGPQGAELETAGLRLLNFGSNDYLGLAADPRLAEAAANAAQEVGWGAGASPLVCGHAELHRRLETRLAEFEGCEAALLFTSGFAANVGAIPALMGPDDVIFGDAKNHASIIDGCRLSRATTRIYPHIDMCVLAAMLAETTSARRRLIVTDALFSMDGNLAPLDQLADLAERYDAMLMVDEAHSTGVFGDRGRGAAEHFGVHHRVHIHVGTLSKAIGSAGGFVAGSRALIEWLANRARPYVFSTASPPASSAAALASFDIIQAEPERRIALLESAAAVRSELVRQGWSVGESQSQIIPILVGSPERAMQLALALRERGLFVPGIRPPSVPEGESLLRISLSVNHSPFMLAELVQSLADLR